MADKDMGTCPCGGQLFRKDRDWAYCTRCGDDTFPITYEAAYGGGDPPDINCGTFTTEVCKSCTKRVPVEKLNGGMVCDDCVAYRAQGLDTNDVADALNMIVQLCGLSTWNHAGDVVRAVEQLKATAISVEDRNQRLLAAITEAIERTEDNGPGAKSILEAAVKRDLPYEPDKGRTHYEGCWRNRGHHNCAVRRIDDVHAENTMCRRVNQKLRDQIQGLFKKLEDAGISHT